MTFPSSEDNNPATLQKLEVDSLQILYYGDFRNPEVKNINMSLLPIPSCIIKANKNI